MEKESSEGFMRNGFGISIAIRCASCRFKQLTKGGRFCERWQRAVLPSESCEEWQLYPAFERAGNGEGKVKKKEYLEFALSSLFGDTHQAEERFLKGNGDIYEDL